MRIEIFTRSMNYRLYDSAMKTIEALPYPRHRLRSTTADGYLMALMKSKADWAINIDEDAFVTDLEALNDLLRYCIDNGIDSCGMPDGGVLPIREHNPLVTNPFFNIFNLNRLREKYSEEEVRKFSQHQKEYERLAPKHLMRGVYQYDYFEPYCEFLVWVSQNFNVLYLDGMIHDDGISTILLNHEGNPFITHTWYSRFYGVDQVHTDRINRIIDRYSVRTNENGIRALSDKIANKIFYPIQKKIEQNKK